MRRRKALLVPLVLLLALLSVPAARGAAYHPFLHSSAGIYEDACGVAPDGGLLYVADYYHNAVEFLNAKGEGVGKLSPESDRSGPCKIEFDAAGNLYVEDWHEDVVKYPAGELLSGHGTVIDSAIPTGLWVEQATGDLYVAHRTQISKYSASGALLQTIGAGHLEEAYGVAVSEFPETAGEVYVPDAASNTVKIFNSSGSLIGQLDGANTPQSHFTYFGDGEIAIDNSPASPSYGHVFVLDAIGHGLTERPAAVIDEFNANGAYRGQITGFTDAEPSGIALDPASHDLYVTSGNTEGSQVFEYGPTSAARTLTVTEEGGGAGTVTTSPVGVACGIGCAAEFNEGQVVTLFANPDSHSTFTGWSVSGAEPCVGTGSCTVVMAKNVEVKAAFAEPTQETLTLSASGEGSVSSVPEGISCPSACTEHFAQGRVVTLKATPAGHHRLAGWSGCAVQSNPTECTVTMSETKAVSVTFEAIPQQPLAVSIAGTGQGTVTSYPPGISCPGACSSSFDEGSTVYLMAAPSPGAAFADFSGGGCTGTAPLCAVSISSAQTLTATFTGAAAGPGSTGVGASASSSFAVTSTRAVGNVAILTIKSGEAGTLLTAGSGIVPSRRELSAGSSRARVKLAPGTARHLRHRHRLQLRLAVGFLPASGAAPLARSLRLRFHAAPPQTSKRQRLSRS